MREYIGIDITEIPETYTKEYMSIKSTHTLAYIAGLVAFIGIIILEEFLGLFSKIGRIIACLLCIDISGQSADFERKLDKLNSVEPVNLTVQEEL